MGPRPLAERPPTSFFTLAALGVGFELDGTGRSAVQVPLRLTVPVPYFPSRVILYSTA